MKIQAKMSPKSKISKSRWILIGGTLISSALFIWLLFHQDWNLTWKTLHQMPVWLWPVSQVLIIFGMLFNAWRWYVLLRAQSVPVSAREVVKTVFGGGFA